MTRIRYSKVNSLLVSKPMVAGRDLVTMTLNPESKTFTFASEASSYTSDPFPSMPALKMAAKAYAKNSGVVFDDEIRTKEVNEMPHGVNLDE